MKRTLQAAARLLVLLTVSGTSPATAADAKPQTADAKSSIERFHSTVLGVMKEAKQLGVKGRYDRLDPIVREFFSFPS